MVWRMIGASALLLVLAFQARGGGETGPPETFAVRAGLIYTLASEDGTPPVIERGRLLGGKGRIRAVGAELEVPEGVPLFDFSDSVIMPGLIAADTRLVPSTGGPETISAKYRSIDGFDPFGDYVKALAGGVTAVYLNPGTRRLISGTGAVVKLGGPIGKDRVLREGGDLCVNLGEAVFNTPDLQEFPLPASSANTIPPAKRQRPKSRLGQYLELKETFAKARAEGSDSAGPAGSGKTGKEGVAYDYNMECLAASLAGNPVLRIHAQRDSDIAGAVRLLKELRLPGYLTGALEAHRVVELLKAAGLAVVIEVPMSLKGLARDEGFTLDPLDARLDTAAKLADAGIPIALTAPHGEPVSGLMMVAAAAVRGGLCPKKALAAITRTPAEILGIADRVGSLTPGKDADFLVLNGKPLSTRTHILKVFCSGREVFSHPLACRTLVVKAGCLLTAAGRPIQNGEMLIEDGKIIAVGLTVPHPPGARVLDAGPEAVITPGFIDGHGHLGLEGDRSTPGTEINIARAVVVPGRHFAKVAAAGVTTIVLSPRGGSAKGTRVAAIKTDGSKRADLVVDELAAIKFSFRGQDLTKGVGSLQAALKAGKAYADSWIKYYEDLKKWEEAQARKKEEAKKKAAAGEAPGKKEGGEAREVSTDKKEKKKEEEKEEVREEVVEQETDPITGTWEYEAKGGRRPEPQTGTMGLNLEGNRITGAIQIFFRGGEELALEGTLDGKSVMLEIDMETPAGKPTITAELDAEDHMVGKLRLGSYMNFDFDARRTEKAEPIVTFTVKKKKAEDGRPEPPELKEKLEPFRKLLAGEICALVDVGTAREIEKVIEVFVEEYKVPLGLLGAEEGYRVAEKIKKAKASVVVPAVLLSQIDGKPFLLADALAREGIPVIFQSGAEDGARNLPLKTGIAVYEGLDAGDALRALTINAAKLYRIDDRVGSLEKGKDADFIIFSGDPFEIQSRVLRVFVSGREVKP